MTGAERRELKKAIDPFKRALAIADALPGGPDDAQPLRQHLAGGWSSLGELRALVKASQAALKKS